MTDISHSSAPAFHATYGLSARAAAVLAPLTAMTYPLYVWCFFTSLTAMRAAEGTGKAALLFTTAASLCLTAIPTLVSYLLLVRPSDRSDPFSGKRWIAYLAFASPALFTFERVVFVGLRSTMDDRLIWVPVWAALAIFAVIPSERRAAVRPVRTGRLRFAHGVSAALILALFLIVHLGNNFIGLLGAQAHIDAMEFLRNWYRAGVVEVAIVGLFLFQVGSGLKLASLQHPTVSDPFRTLQIASGIGLMAFLSAHLLVIFVVARTMNNIDTNWIFATGFKIGILGNLNNARQAPYYWFALFATFAHLACGLRIVMLGHGVRRMLSDRLALAIICIGALFASATVAGLVGVRLV